MTIFRKPLIGHLVFIGLYFLREEAALTAEHLVALVVLPDPAHPVLDVLPPPLNTVFQVISSSLNNRMSYSEECKKSSKAGENRQNLAPASLYKQPLWPRINILFKLNTLSKVAAEAHLALP